MDITANARRIVFSGLFSAGADLAVVDGTLTIRRQGRVRKLVRTVEQVSFSGRRARAQGQEITYVTERCVLKLTSDGVAVTEIAPGIDLQRDVLAQAEFPLLVPEPPRLMDAALFRPERIGLVLHPRAA